MVPHGAAHWFDALCEMGVFRDGSMPQENGPFTQQNVDEIVEIR